MHNFVNIGPSLAHEAEENHAISADQTTIGDLDNGPTSIFYLTEISIDQVLTNLKQLEYIVQIKFLLSLRYRGAVLWNSLSYEAETAQSTHFYLLLVNFR